jgi:hypothetical protein
MNRMNESINHSSSNNSSNHKDNYKYKYIEQHQQPQVGSVGWGEIYLRSFVVSFFPVESCCSVVYNFATDDSLASLFFCTSKHTFPVKQSNNMAPRKVTRKTTRTSKAGTKTVATTKDKAKTKMITKKKVVLKTPKAMSPGGENLDPQREKGEMDSSKKVVGGSRFARRTGQTMKVNYHENSGSDTDPISTEDEDDSDVEGKKAPAKKKRATTKKENKNSVVNTQTTKSNKNPKITTSPSVRPPDCSSPRAIVGRYEPSPVDWRVQGAQDY